MTEAADPSVFLLLTRWTDETSFRAWHRSEAHHKSHQFMPPGLKLDASFTSLTVGNSVLDGDGAQTLSDALEGQTVAVSQWLAKSNEVCALLLAPDGTIRARNRASRRIFPVDTANIFGVTIWDYLVASDAAHLRRRLAEPEAQDEGRLLLNLSAGQHNPVTLEVGLVRSKGAFLLLGTPEHRLDPVLQTEALRMANDLSVMMRESVRNNRELKAANETIERLARTDALTNLANRRALDEAMLREIARAKRTKEPLSLLIADLDFFKSINDVCGHFTGDQVLARAAAVFGSRSRYYDLAARYGGDEFLLLLPGTSTADAVAVAHRIRSEVAEIKLLTCTRQFTLSIGVATWIPGEAIEEFIVRGDKGALCRQEQRPKPGRSPLDTPG